MRNLAFIIIVILSVSCNNDSAEKDLSEAKTQMGADSDVAVRFINDYIGLSGKSEDFKNWLTQGGLVTDNFISEFTRINEEAFKEDPEMGLGFDPYFIRSRLSTRS